MIRRLFRILAVAVLATILSARADAQQQPPPAAPDKAAPGQPAAPEAPKPPAELQKFAGWIGAWDGEQHMFATPLSPESKDKSKTFFHWILNGFHLEGVHSFQMMGKPMQARSIWSYDPEKKEYNCVWIDAMSPMAMVYTGNFTDDGKLVVKATYTMQGKTVNDVVTYAFPTPDSYTMRYETDMGGKMAPMVEETGKRLKAGAPPAEGQPASGKPAEKAPAEGKAAPKKK